MDEKIVGAKLVNHKVRADKVSADKALADDVMDTKAINAKIMNEKFTAATADDDRRTVTRTRIQRNAKIIVPNRTSVIHCTVQNITSSGACLKLANTAGMPQTFDLTFEHGRTRRACRVVWRTNDMLGVAFEDGEADG